MQRRAQENRMDDSPPTEGNTGNEGLRFFSKGRQIRTPARLLVVDSPKGIQEKRG